MKKKKGLASPYLASKARRFEEQKYSVGVSNEAIVNHLKKIRKQKFSEQDLLGLAFIEERKRLAKEHPKWTEKELDRTAHANIKAILKLPNDN
jgi:hypothetical protein